VRDTSRLALIVLLGAYILLAVTYSLANPLFESTDELRHFRYVRHLVVHHRLPVQQPGAPRAQSHHPPLYYALVAVISGWVPVTQDVYYAPPENPFWAYRYWEAGIDNKNLYLHGSDERFPFHGLTLAVYVVRWATIAMGATAVWLTYRAGCTAFAKVPCRHALALGGASLVAFNPQFLYLSGAVNNDIPAALWGSALLWICIYTVRTGPSVRADLTAGIVFGLSLLTKFNLLILLLPIGLAYLIAAWHPRDGVPVLHTLGRFLRSMLTTMGIAALISGWWFWRNYTLYGDLTGMNVLNELWAGRPALENWWAIKQSLPYLWSSLWGRFGYGQIPLPPIVYQGILIFCLLALCGHLLPKGGRIPSATEIPAAVVLLLVVFILTVVTVVSYYILIQPAGAMGRFLFPGLPAFAILVFAGLRRFFHPTRSWMVSLTVSIGAAAVAIYALVCALMPAFARPRPLTEQAFASIPNPTAIEFGTTRDAGYSRVAQLLGYRVAPHTVRPGDTIDVTVYWRTLARTDQNYAVFAHLLSDVGMMIAQRDSHPGLGRYPTSAWEPGIAFADTYRVHIPETAYAPDTGYVQVGLYLPDGSRLTTDDGRDAVRLVSIEVQPHPGDLPNPMSVNFGDLVALVGYKMDRRTARPGETIRLRLYWQALAPIEADYRVFAHVLGIEDQLWANSDSQPAGGAAPTGQWQVGETVEDIRDLKLGLTTPPDFYDIEVGVYLPDNGRLPVIAEDGVQLGKRILLSKVRVVDDE
jgi:hypothetical protein